MGDATSGGDSPPAAALLVIIPPVMIVLVAVLAIKCIAWYPHLRVQLKHWSKAAFTRDHTRASSDLSDDTSAIGPPTQLEGGISGKTKSGSDPNLPNINST